MGRTEHATSDGARDVASIRYSKYNTRQNYHESGQMLMESPIESLRITSGTKTGVGLDTHSAMPQNTHLTSSPGLNYHAAESAFGCENSQRAGLPPYPSLSLA